MIYNNWGEQFYIKGIDSLFFSNIIALIWPWFMPLLFVLSGIGTVHSLEKRPLSEYITERLLKLLVPLVSSILLIVPSMPFFGDKYHNGYLGNYFQHYIIFFTKFTDLTGYDGGFTLGHLWFVLYLFIISLITLPLILLKKKISISNLNIVVLLLLFVIPLLGQLVLDISGKSLGEYLAFFLIGYYIFSNDELLVKFEKSKYMLYTIFFGCMALIFMGFNKIINLKDIVYDIIAGLYAYTGIIVFLITAKKHLNKNNKIFTYLSKSSFYIYIFHQIWIVIIAYYVFKYIDNIILQILIILLSSIVFTYGTYEIIKKIRIIRFLFGIKK
jgi:peptidoglycan/LPS O-acetylase OafA/YrhL